MCSAHARSGEATSLHLEKEKTELKSQAVVARCAQSGTNQATP
jgi:hypothetical protein